MYKNNLNSLGNIKKEYAEAAKEAAKQTGFNIVVENYAVSIDGVHLPSLVHLVTYDPTKDHEPFWDKFHELKDK